MIIPDSGVNGGIISTDNSSDEWQNTKPVTSGTTTEEVNVILKGEKNQLQHVKMGFALSCPIAPPRSDIPLWYTVFNRLNAIDAILRQLDLTLYLVICSWR